MCEYASDLKKFISKNLYAAITFEDCCLILEYLMLIILQDESLEGDQDRFVEAIHELK